MLCFVHGDALVLFPLVHTHDVSARECALRGQIGVFLGHDEEHVQREFGEAGFSIQFCASYVQYVHGRLEMSSEFTAHDLASYLRKVVTRVMTLIATTRAD